MGLDNAIEPASITPLGSAGLSDFLTTRSPRHRRRALAIVSGSWTRGISGTLHP